MAKPVPYPTNPPFAVPVEPRIGDTPAATDPAAACDSGGAVTSPLDRAIKGACRFARPAAVACSSCCRNRMLTSVKPEAHRSRASPVIWASQRMTVCRPDASLFVDFTRVSPPLIGAITLHLREIKISDQHNRGACGMVICHDCTRYMTSDTYEVVRQPVLGARED